MIISAICKSLSDYGTSTFVELECDNGMIVKFQFSRNESCPFNHREQYVIEVNPVIKAITQ